MTARGLYQSSFSTGNDADKPSEYPAATNVALYWAGDTGVLYARAIDDADWTPTYTLPAATETAAGGVKHAAAQADSTAADVPTLVADFNTLLANMRAAGMLAAE